MRPTPSTNFRAGTYERIPWAGKEAEAIVRLVPSELRFQAVGFDANRDALFRQSLGEYRILHFGTHVAIDREEPELSSLVMSLFDSHGRPQDGLVRAYELSSLDLSAALVSISGCDAASGLESRGKEGIQGLSGRFLAIGVPRVVASRWSITDRAAADLMVSFYANLLREGLSPSLALREAQLRMAAEKRWTSPYYWGGFSLCGDWRWDRPHVQP